MPSAVPRLVTNANLVDCTTAGRARKLLFVDPAVADRDTILGNLRPGVEGVMLDSARPAARQIAAALEGRRGLDAVHVIAHGAPGRVGFAAGEWSVATLGDHEPVSLC